MYYYGVMKYINYDDLVCLYNIIQIDTNHKLIIETRCDNDRKLIILFHCLKIV